jgi:hypothetical protein
VYNLHNESSSGQRQHALARSHAVKRGAQAVIGRIVDVPLDRVSLTGADDRPGCVDELLFKSGVWPDARRAAMMLIAGDIAAWIADDHLHAALFVLTAEIAEWASGLEPDGVTGERLRAYAGVSAMKRGAFAAAMMDVVEAVVALTTANWALIEAVVGALLARRCLLDADLQCLVAGRAVVPAEIVIWGGADVH